MSHDTSRARRQRRVLASALTVAAVAAGSVWALSAAGDDELGVSAVAVQEIGFGAQGGRGTIHDRPQRIDREGARFVDMYEAVETDTARLRIVDVQAFDATAHVPGEISGPAIGITVEITNRSSQVLNLDNVSIDLVDKSDTSATPVTVEGHAPFTGDHAPGATATARYAFVVPPELRDKAQVRITYAPAPEPAIFFTGRLPNG